MILCLKFFFTEVHLVEPEAHEVCIACNHFPELSQLPVVRYLHSEDTHLQYSQPGNGGLRGFCGRYSLEYTWIYVLRVSQNLYLRPIGTFSFFRCLKYLYVKKEINPFFSAVFFFTVVALDSFCLCLVIITCFCASLLGYL